MKSLLKVLLAHVLVFSSFTLSGQTDTYILNGSATQNSCNCYTLTQPQGNLSGSVWNANKINLNNPFDFIFNVFLGCQDVNGADGIVFILQPLSTSIGSSGGGMGFAGIVPSVGIALDTWQNVEVNDPPYDHISIQVNGNTNHNSDVVPLVQALPSNPDIEDCQWHTFRITWDPGAKILKTYFDGNFSQQANIDLIVTIFNNDPLVYWGFSGATGGSNNLQQFCTALNPNFNTSTIANASCAGIPVIFTNTSQSFSPLANFFWDFGDNTTSNLANPPPHLFPAPGTYEVKMVITALDGCRSDTLKKPFIIGDYPVAGFEIYDTCAGKSPRINDQSQVTWGLITEWQWTLDGNFVSASQNPLLTGLSPGPHDLQLIVKSNHGCSSSPVSSQFLVNPVPVIEANVLNGCVNVPLAFAGSQIDNATNIARWDWKFGDNQTSVQQNTLHTFDTTGNYNVQLMAIADNGCASAIVNNTVFINQAIANAGRDTILVQYDPFQLNGRGGGGYNWTPSLGLDNPAIANPVAMLQDDITYTLTVTTSEGCIDTDEINIIVFKGSAVYVPNAFTPNNDGLNDILKPYYGGIKTLDHFSVYNRWGELIYSTKNMSQGWNAMIKGIAQPNGVYIWVLKATDYVGKVYQLKGTSTIIR